MLIFGVRFDCVLLRKVEGAGFGGELLNFSVVRVDGGEDAAGGFAYFSVGVAQNHG